MRPTFRSLNHHLTIMACDRQLFCLACILGVGFWVVARSFITGIILFAVFYIVGYFKAKDPSTLPLLINGNKARKQFDPSIRKPFDVVLYDADNTK